MKKFSLSSDVESISKELSDVSAAQNLLDWGKDGDLLEDLQEHGKALRAKAAEAVSKCFSDEAKPVEKPAEPVKEPAKASEPAKEDVKAEDAPSKDPLKGFDKK